MGIWHRRRISAIINPWAAQGRAARQWSRARSLVSSHLGRVDTWVTSAPGDAAEMAAHIVRRGDDLLVCIGGDGTFNEVINGYMRAAAPGAGKVPLALYPAGTGRDLARSLDLPNDMQAFLQLLSEAQICWMDLGKLTCKDRQGRRVQTYFHNVASFGLGGEVDDRVSRSRKLLGGSAAFLWATLGALVRFDRKRIRLRVDDIFDEEVLIWNVAVANGQYHGAGMWVAPGAQLDDGRFEVTVVGDLTLAEILRHLPKLYDGRIYTLQKVRHMTGRRIQAASPQRVLLDMDGEQPGMLPATIEMVAGAVPVMHGPAAACGR